MYGGILNLRTLCLNLIAASEKSGVHKVWWVFVGSFSVSSFAGMVLRLETVDFRPDLSDRA